MDGSMSQGMAGSENSKYTMQGQEDVYSCFCLM